MAWWQEAQTRSGVSRGAASAAEARTTALGNHSVASKRRDASSARQAAKRRRTGADWGKRTLRATLRKQAAEIALAFERDVLGRDGEVGEECAGRVRFRGGEAEALDHEQASVADVA
jgi:hypothetical protein